MQEMARNACGAVATVPEEQRANFTLLIKGALEDI
jgi:hypothetical protein